MVKGHFKHFLNVFIRQGIKAHLAISPGFYQSGLFQQTKLVRYRRLIHLQEQRQITNAQFRLAQRTYDLRPGRITKGFKLLGHLDQIFLLRHRFFHFIYQTVSHFYFPSIPWPFAIKTSTT